MDQVLQLPNHVNVIGPTTDYACKWGLNAGLSDEKALRLALAVDELVTDVVRFAFPGEDDTFLITFRAGLSTAEVIIHERGGALRSLSPRLRPAAGRRERQL